MPKQPHGASPTAKEVLGLGSDETEGARDAELDALVNELRQVLGTTPDGAFTVAGDATRLPQEDEPETTDGD
ncbi:hypothetical protein [Phytoactinopolyspora endophytica]|uniref:hypothetical protein n=1 Tax=Phytoactinopolyspora endophytica TaxID=1642495 RepID=UPI00101DF27D|nr:hypothetical protein [Phytoactinopolyspora endophytica]